MSWSGEMWLPERKKNQQENKAQDWKDTEPYVKAGFHLRMSISNKRRYSKVLLSSVLCQENFLTNSTSYQHLTASEYVDLCLCLAASKNCH